MEKLRKDSCLCHDLTPGRGNDELRDGAQVPSGRFILYALAGSLVVEMAKGDLLLEDDHFESFSTRTLAMVSKYDRLSLGKDP